MDLQIPQALGGPVLHWELVLSGRRLWCCLLHYGFLVWLLVQLLVFLAGASGTDSTENSYPPWVPPPSKLDEGYKQWTAQLARASNAVSSLLYQQLAIIFLLTPICAAGALGYEKEQDTLTALLGTQLLTRDIVIGKLLGRTALLMRFVLAPFPILIVLTIFAEQSLVRVLLAEVQAVVLGFAVVAIAILAGVWTRRTSDAILGCYAMIVIGFLGGEAFLSDLPFASNLEPVTVLRRLLTPEDSLRPFRFGFHLLAWLMIGFACLALARKQLRKVTLDQLEQRPSRWVWAFRPRVSNDPVRWRERYVIGLAPLPILRIIPVWLGMLSVFTFSAILAVAALNSVTTQGFVRAFLVSPWVATINTLRAIVFQARFFISRERLADEVIVMGIILVIAAIMVVGVRCFTSITEEKRRKTWDDLIMTPLPLHEIVRGKRHGVIQAAIPYVLMYALPMFGLGALGGKSGLTAAALWLAVACVAILGTAWFASEAAPDSFDMEGFERKSQIGEVTDGWGP